MENHQELEIKPIAIPGIHEKFMDYIIPLLNSYDNPEVLDIGAGHGAMVQKLYNAGYKIAAADLFPEYFKFKKVNCKKVDITKKFPYDDNSFDVIIAVEIMEHVHDHENFFRETYRILKENGILVFSTPNILSLKSRMRFLFSGFFYAFKPIDHTIDDGLQHIASLTFDQYTSLALKSNYKQIDLAIDKKQSTSRYLYFLVPLLRLYCAMKKITYNIHNSKKLLLGRILFVKLTR